MKNYLMLALLLGAATTMTFGQVGVSDAAKISVACPDDECHVTQVFMGQGGFVGMAAEGFDAVNFVVTCGSISTSGTAMPNAAGVVSHLLSDDNGLSCHVKGGGSVEVHGVMDGAWYYITDEMNTAVANLLPKDAMDNVGTPAANPGSADIEVMAGDTASYVKQLSTGRVGIISHILPEPPTPEPQKCLGTGTATNRTQMTSNCMLGNGGTDIIMTAQAQGGQTGGQVKDVGDSVYRNTANGGGDYTINLLLVSNGSGHVVTDTTGTHGAWLGRGRTTPFEVTTWAVTVGNATPGTAQDLAEANVSVSDAAITISPSANYCGGGNNRSAELWVRPTPAANAVLPAIATHATGALAGTTTNPRRLMVHCPATSSNQQGQELVPDNPFPTEE